MLKKIAGAVVAVAPLSAFAAVPTDVSTALSGIQADAVSVATVMVGIVAALLVFKFIRGQMH